MNYTVADLQGKPITIKCTGLKPMRTATIIDASGEVISNITRIQIYLDAAVGGLVPRALVTLFRAKNDGTFTGDEETAETENVQIEIDAKADVVYEQ